MNVKKFLPNIAALLLPILLLSGCGGDNTVTETTATESETVTTKNEYSLVRGWTGSELLDSIFFCGENRPLPISAEDTEGFTLSGNTLIFPDGSYAQAGTDEEGNIISLRFERLSAPSDFSVYGIDFKSRPDDVPSKVGIANSVYGDKDETIIYSFYEGGIAELTFVYTDRQLESVYIAS